MTTKIRITIGITIRIRITIGITIIRITTGIRIAILHIADSAEVTRLNTSQRLNVLLPLVGNPLPRWHLLGSSAV
jgi:hypothetical protein